MRRNQGVRLRHWTVGLALLLGAFLTVGVAVRLSAQNGSIVRVSVNNAGGEANADSFFPAINADGTIVAFKTTASNLDNNLPDDTQFDDFIRDLANQITLRVSVTSNGFPGNGNSLPPAVDDSGDLVAFASNANNMVPNDSNSGADVFVRNWKEGTTEAVSLTSAGTLPLAGGSRDLPPSISGDGRYVAFETTAILTPNDPNTDIADAYVRDRLEGVTELISVRTVTRDPQPAFAPAISRDGCVVAFVSPSDRLIPQGGDPNEKLDVYARIRCADPEVTELLTIGFDGQPTTRDSQSSLFPVGITDDGELVAFESLAINLVPNDTNNVSDVFIRNRATDTTERVSVNSYGDQANGPSTQPAISGDGRYVVFSSTATNFVEGTDGRANVYVRDRQTNETCQVSIGPETTLVGDSVNPAISRDGHWITFESTAPLLPGGTPGRRNIYLVENSEENQNCPVPATPTATVPPPTNTPDDNTDCCQCEGTTCEQPSGNTCPESCGVVFQAACAAEEGCVTFTPTPILTPTPTPDDDNDCCQCEGTTCEAPSGNTCPESCGVVFQAACIESGCATFTPTPPGTPTPTIDDLKDCCDCPEDPNLCTMPSGHQCPEGCGVDRDSSCAGAPQGCVTNTPTPTATVPPTPSGDDCCACPENTCSEPSEGTCPEGCTVALNSSCVEGTGCVANTPTPTIDTNTRTPTRTSTQDPSSFTPTRTPTTGGGTPTRTPTNSGGGGSGGGCGCEIHPQPRNMTMVALRDLVALFGPVAIWRLRRRRTRAIR